MSKLYPCFDETEAAMISLFGIPKYSTTSYAKTTLLSNFNGKSAKQWLTTVCEKDSSPYFFIGIGTILKPWWIEVSQSQIINAHSAVLPHARGIYALENIAASQDIEKFQEAAGTTVHYVDSGVDTGPIIRVKKVANPFGFNSIWELKGSIYSMGFDLLIEVTKNIVSSSGINPVGVSQNLSLKTPNFKQKDFTLHKRKQAEEGYLAMKSLVAP
ncbi:MAG: formyltransferase family protein [Spirulinaceae cyanobacterium]